MNLKVRKENRDGEVRLETKGKIVQIRIKEDFLRPGKETIELCFRGDSSSGIVSLDAREFDTLSEEIKNRIHLVKSVKVIKDN